MNPPTRDEQHEAGLVARAAAGDREAFAGLVRLYQRPLFSFLGRMGLRQSEAEEIAQDTFLRSWLHLDRYRVEQGAYSTWLYTIARRLALNALDRGDRRLMDTQADAPPDVASTQPGPAQSMEARQASDALHTALRQLPAHDRCVLALAYVQELGLAEVARIEGCTTAAVKARLHRARQRLRQALGEVQPEPQERSHDDP